MNPNQTKPVIAADLLTPDELAAQLRVSPQFVYKRSRRGAKDPLPVIRVGRVLRFSAAAVADWLARQSSAPAAPTAA